MPTPTRPPESTRRRTRGRPPKQASHLHAQATQPATAERLAWYVGLALMAAFDVIDWPVALVIAVGHELASRGRERALREFAQGLVAGA
jgi:hypothetical protein